MRVLYSVFYTLLLPFIFARLLFRSIKAPSYRQRWPERLGFFTPTGLKHPCIWVHAVSVGETLAAVPLINQLRNSYPGKTLVVTTMTPTGSEQVKRIFGAGVFHVYAPYDLPCFIYRFIKATQPDLAIIMETELWPNIIHCCFQKNIPLIVANARLSEKSYRGYTKVKSFSEQIVTKVTCFAVQTLDDANRFKYLGVDERRIVVTGNIKFDLQLDEKIKAKRDALARQLHIGGKRPVFIAASTHRGEDEIILAMFRQLLESHPDLLLIIVPRHPERFAEVARLCKQMHFKQVTRSTGQLPTAQHQVILGDTVGELLLLLGLADIAFIGGSLVPVGGHNMIEAAAWGIPVLTGPHLFNFNEASNLLISAGAMTLCKDLRQLTETTEQLLSNTELRTQQGKMAFRVAEQNRGALKKLVSIVEQQLG